MILSQKSVKSHVKNHVNDEYYKCCFEICLIVYLFAKGINQKLILILPSPLQGYKFISLGDFFSLHDHFTSSFEQFGCLF